MKPKSRAHETFRSIKDGGSQIEFEDENPQVHADFEAALKKVGAKCQMGAYHPYCTEKENAAAE